MTVSPLQTVGGLRAGLQVAITWSSDTLCILNGDPSWNESDSLAISFRRVVVVPVVASFHAAVEVGGESGEERIAWGVAVAVHGELCFVED